MLRTIVACFLFCIAMAHAAPVAREMPVLAVAFSPDSRLLASGAQDGTISLWTVPGLQPVRQLRGHSDGVTSLVFSRDGKTLYSGSMERKVRIWSVDDGKELASLGPHSDDVLFVALSPDGRRLAASSYDGATVVWDVAKREKAPFKLAGHTVDWSRDGRYLSTATLDGSLYLYTPDGKQVARWKGHTKCPNVARFSPDSTLVASCVDHVKLWDVRDHAMKAEVDAKIPRLLLSSLVWSADGRHMLVTTQLGGGARLDLKGGKWVASPLAPGTNVQTAAFSPDGKFVAIGNLHGTIELLAAGGKVLAKRTMPAPAGK